MLLQEGLWSREVETVEAGGNGVKNPRAEIGEFTSVVQTPVEVTEPSLSSN